MNIYKDFVKSDILISPVNGYRCRRITKQNIKNFGFNCINDLHDTYSGFPLMCKESKKNDLAISRKAETSKLEYIPKQCMWCNSLILYEKRHNKFCSRSCSAKSNNTDNKRSEHTKMKIGKSLKGRKRPDKMKHRGKCSICNKVVQKYARKTCSDKCMKELMSINGRAIANKTPRRSKKEIELFYLCEKYFNKVTANEQLIDGWDADILIHDSNTAILWNGPWHYQEMKFAKHSLKQVVNRDIIKIIEFEKIGWDVIIYEDDKITPEEAFIDVILNT